MKDKNIFGTIRDNIQEVLQRKTSFAKSLWLELVDQHPVDIAEFITNIDRLSMQKVFLKLPKELKFDVFEELSDTLKAYCLSFLTELDQVDVLHALSIDDLTDLFDYLSDEELKRYLNLLHKRSREKVLSLLKFDPDSAGGIMDIEVLALMENYTVEKSIKILQRLRPDQEVYHQIYVTNKNQQLAGHINLEDLVLQTPKTRLSEFLRKNQLVAQAYEDQESIAKRMVHYNLTTVPVVGADNHFLGVIPSETLMDVLVEEASEDVQKMAALAPMKRTYLEMPVYKILISRGSILVVLLLAESVTGSIIHSNEQGISNLTGGIILLSFITMLISTGGNTSHQTSALVIQGISSGELTSSNIFKFLKREFLVAILLALILGSAAFFRAYITTGSVLKSSIVAVALGSIALLAVVLGSGTPLLLKRFNIDPAFAAGPFLATFMDIVGVSIYILLIKLVLM